jgi:hypothetical protein
MTTVGRVRISLIEYPYPDSCDYSRTSTAPSAHPLDDCTDRNGKTPLGTVQRLLRRVPGLDIGSVVKKVDAQT